MKDSKPKVTASQRVSGGRKEKEKYDSIFTTQQAVNMAIAEKRVVRFETNKSNKEIMRTVDDLKGCTLRKPDKEALEVAIIPPGIEDFCFEEEVDTKVESDSRIVVPRPKIYTPYG